MLEGASAARLRSMSHRTSATFGVLTVVVFLAAFPLGVAGEPGATAPTAETVAYWTKHGGTETLLAILGAVSAAALVAFGAGLRGVLRGPDGGAGELAAIGFAGIVIAAAAILTSAGVTFTVADTAGHVAPQVTQTLSALNADFFLPVAIGFALMLIGCGVAAIRAGLWPTWAGWLSVALGVAGFTPAGIVEYAATPIWILAVSVWLLRRRHVSSHEVPQSTRRERPDTRPSIDLASHR
jgi:hypothetical protein